MLSAATLLLLLAPAVFAQPVPDPFLQDAQSAKAFCSSPTFKSLTCGWAAKAEEDATTKNQSPWSGTIWTAQPSLKMPITLASSPMYYQQAGHIISLACKGKVVVRAVFKVLAQPSDSPNCAYAFMNNDAGASPSPVIRCELQLPAGPAPEAQRALASKEANCYVCNRCGDDNGGCPAVVGKWYSDSYTTTVEGCNSKFADGYTAETSSIGLNPRGSIQVAKWEVCNSPPCFDATYEANKARTAKKCKAAVCPK